MKISSQEEPIETRLLIGCDGANSFVRKKFKIPVHGYAYNQMGLVSTVKPKQFHNLAYQRFYQDNILALLPLHDEYYSCVWSVNLEKYDYLLSLNDESFV